MSTSNISQNNIINRISKNLLKRLDPSIANDVIKNIPKQLYKNLKKNNLLKKQKEYKILENVLSEDDYKSESLETNSDYISSTNLPYNIPVHQNNLYRDTMQPKYLAGSYIPPKIMSTGIEGFDGEGNTNQDVPVPDSSTEQSDTPPAAQSETPPAAQSDTPPAAQSDTPPAAQSDTPAQQPATQSDTQSAAQPTAQPTAQPDSQPPTTQQTATQQPAAQPPTQQPAPIAQPAAQQPVPIAQPVAQLPAIQQTNMPITSLPLNIFSLDLRQLVSFSLKAIGDTYSDIYDLFKNNSPITVMSLIGILLNDNRILYLGISFLLVAVVMYIINNFIRIPALFSSNSGEKKVYINNY